jgi:hypothetical protein
MAPRLKFEAGTYLNTFRDSSKTASPSALSAVVPQNPVECEATAGLLSLCATMRKRGHATRHRPRERIGPRSRSIARATPIVFSDPIGTSIEGTIGVRNRLGQPSWRGGLR